MLESGSNRILQELHFAYDAMVLLSHSVHTCALFLSNLPMSIHTPDKSTSIPCLSHIEIPFVLLNSKDILHRGMLV